MASGWLTRCRRAAVASRGTSAAAVGVLDKVAAAHAQAGRLDQARAIMDKYRQARPDATVSGKAKSPAWPYKNPADLQHLLDGMRKAGMPE